MLASRDDDGSFCREDSIEDQSIPFQVTMAERQFWMTELTARWGRDFYTIFNGPNLIRKLLRDPL